MKVLLLFNCSYAGMSGKHNYVIETEINDTCPDCGAYRGNPMPLEAVTNTGEVFNILVPSFPCGHFKNMEELYRESLQLPRAVNCIA